MSGENDAVDSSSSGSDMEQDCPSQVKSAFRGEIEDILPVRKNTFYILDLYKLLIGSKTFL